MKKNLISVVIPAYNEEAFIARTLQAVHAQDYKPYEVIVVDNASTDDTSRIASDYADVYGLEQRGVSRARNFGAKKSRGDVLFFLDADSVLGEGVLEQTNNLINLGLVGGSFVSGIIDPGLKDRIFGRAFSIMCYYKRIFSMCAFCRRDIFMHMNSEHNIYNENVAYLEDDDFSSVLKQHGLTIVSRSARVRTSNRRLEKNGYLKSFAQWIRKYYHRGDVSRYEVFR